MFHFFAFQKALVFSKQTLVENSTNTGQGSVLTTANYTLLPDRSTV